MQRGLNKFGYTVFVGACLLLSSLPTHASDRPISARVVGVRMNEAPYKNDNALNVLNAPQAGGELAILVTSSGPDIVRIDAEASERSAKLFYIDSDNRRTPAAGDALAIWPFLSFAADKKAALLTVKLKNLPPKSAQMLEVDLHVQVISSSTERQQTVMINLRDGETFSIGPAKIVVKSVGQPKVWGRDKDQYKLSFDLLSDDQIGTIKEFKFYDEAGKQIKFKKGGTSRFGFAGQSSVSTNYNLTRKLDRIKVTATYWVSPEQRSVPVSFKLPRLF
jgi:hypothetical protein